MKVHWTETAAGHLTALHDYIARDSEIYARRMIDRLTSRSKQIARFPRSGRAVPEFERADVREVIEGPYRIIYRLLPNQIHVLAVVHSARELPPSADQLSSIPA
ncbi:MAG: type II toxin-antitoxin system RelE/ParE family toxin [Gemmatimonadetes bacterium]|nr:type II toxin-antitoxin system RelE/ParE family toxin [Gemmatimonadota bacterium]